MISFDDLVKLSNDAVAAAKPGTRPAFTLDVGGLQPGRRWGIAIGPATLSGKILGHRNDGTKEAPKWITVVRFFSDEVHRELLRRGLVQMNKPHEVLDPAGVDLSALQEPSPLVSCVCGAKLAPSLAHAPHDAPDGTRCMAKKLDALCEIVNDLAADAPARPEDVVKANP